MCSLGGGHENTVSMKGNEAPMADLLQASRRLFGDVCFSLSLSVNLSLLIRVKGLDMEDFKPSGWVDYVILG